MMPIESKGKLKARTSLRRTPIGKGFARKRQIERGKSPFQKGETKWQQ